LISHICLFLILCLLLIFDCDKTLAINYRLGRSPMKSALRLVFLLIIVSSLLGAQFLFTEYTTSTKVQQLPEQNDRFRNKSLLLCLGISWRLKNKNK